MGSKWAKTMIFSKKVVKKQLFWVSRFWIIQLRTGLWPIFLKISLTSTGVLKNLEHKLRNELWARRQISILAKSKLFDFFRCGHEKMLKNDFFHKTLIPRNLLKETHIQARSMLKLTSWGFRKCGTYWACEVLNGSYRPSKMDESEKTAPSPKIRGV